MRVPSSDKLRVSSSLAPSEASGELSSDAAMPPTPTLAVKAKRLAVEHEAAAASAAAGAPGAGETDAQVQQRAAAPHLRTITFHEALNAIRRRNFASEYARIVPEVRPRGGGARAFLLLCCPPPRLHSRNAAERDLVFAIALLPFSNGDMVHLRMLQKTWEIFHPDGEMSSADGVDAGAVVPRYGEHWEAVGFSGTDPAASFREVGILALLHILYFNQIARDILLDIFRLSRSDRQRFPFADLCVEMSRFSLACLREGVLVRAVNASRNPFETVGRFMAALVFRFCNTWRTQQLTLVDYTSTRDRAQQYGQRRSHQLLLDFELAVDARLAESTNNAVRGSHGLVVRGNGAPFVPESK